MAAQGSAVADYLGDNCKDARGRHRLLHDRLGVSDEIEAAVAVDAQDPVHHILPIGAGVEDHIAAPQGPLRRPENYAVAAAGQKGTHTAAGDRDGPRTCLPPPAPAERRGSWPCPPGGAQEEAPPVPSASEDLLWPYPYLYLYPYPYPYPYP